MANLPAPEGTLGAVGVWLFDDALDGGEGRGHFHVQRPPSARAGSWKLRPQLGAFILCLSLSLSLLFLSVYVFLLLYMCVYPILSYPGIL